MHLCLGKPFMKKILITGSNGQLGKCLKDISINFPDFQYVFASKKELDISDFYALKQFFEKNNFTHCINTAAYTAVETAESESEAAYVVNADAVKNLALVCKQFDVILFHISTDYVFDGTKRTPYTETDPPNPINVYGASKLKGEENIRETWKKHFIFRTSWLYSQYGKNFLKSILKMADSGKDLTITTEQIGTPTNANDLAEALLQTIAQDTSDFGVYHFSNRGETTWYGFAKAILEFSNKLDPAKLAKTNLYSTFAQRPKYSVLNNEKAVKKLNINHKDWQDSLQSLIKKVQINNS